MESFVHHEWRTRKRLRWDAAWKAGLVAGAFFFVFSGGSPWSSHGTMNAVMGRRLPHGLLPIAAAHFALALGYATVIGSAIYRFRAMAAIWLGACVGVGLYFLNWAAFAVVLPAGNEPRVFFVHVLFALFASILYKALA